MSDEKEGDDGKDFLAALEAQAKAEVARKFAEIRRLAKELNLPLSALVSNPQTPSAPASSKIEEEPIQAPEAASKPTPQPTSPQSDRRLGELIDLYQSHPDSAFQRVTYKTRQHYIATLEIIKARGGKERLADITARTFKKWHDEWSEGGKIATAHLKATMLRGLFTFGATILDDKQCSHLSSVLSSMRFPVPKARTQVLTAAQAKAICAVAREERPSIALVQALQFEAGLGQKQVIGEWVPVGMAGESEIVHKGFKWINGLRWGDISDDWILTVLQGRNQERREIDLKRLPTVMEQFGRFERGKPDDPLVISEFDGLPWDNVEFRRIWRIYANKAGVPKEVRNMDSARKTGEPKVPTVDDEDSVLEPDLDLDDEGQSSFVH